MIEIIRTHICSDALVVEKEIYFMIVIGQLTALPIILNFYQNIMSTENTKKKIELKYMGKNLIDYELSKRLGFLQRAFSSRIFGIAFGFEIIYKPLIFVFDELFSETIVSALNSVWYMIVISIFIFLGMFLFSCTACVLSIRKLFNDIDSSQIIQELNKKYVRSVFRYRFDKERVNIVSQSVNHIENWISEDSLRIDKYVDLMRKLFKKYISCIEQEQKWLFIYGKKVKCQIGWIYNKNIEIHMLSELNEEKYVHNNPDFECCLQRWELKMIELFLKRAEYEGYEKVNIHFWGEKSKSTINCVDYRDLIQNTYIKSSTGNKKRIVQGLINMQELKVQLIKEFSTKMLREILGNDLDRVYKDENYEEICFGVWSELLRIDAFNYFLLKKLSEKYIYNDKFYPSKLIQILEGKYKNALFVYIFMYHSIYKFRNEWTYINIELMRELFQEVKKIEEDEETIKNLLYSSCFEHRYEDVMYTELVRNLKYSMNGEWVDKIYNQNVIDPFYVIVMNLCVLNGSYDNSFSTGGMDSNIRFINEISKHEEILRFEKVQDMVFAIGYRLFRNHVGWPENLKITFRTLLLTDVLISDEMIDDKVQYLYYRDVGKYLLVNYAKNGIISPIRKQVIKKAFVESDLSIEKYIEAIEKEAIICNYKITYINKEKMKNYLTQIMK